MVQAQAITMEQSQIFVSEQYRWHMMIEAEWEDMQQKNSPRDIFTRFAHYLQFNLDDTCFLCDEVELKVLGRKNKPRHEKNCSDLRF